MFIGISIITWLVILEAILMLICAATESNVWALVSIAAFYSGVRWLAGIDAWLWIKDNGAYTAEMALAYFGIGLLWSLTKWYLHVRKIKAKYLQIKATYRAKDEKDLEHEVRMRIGKLPPKASEHKEKIVNWIAYWPSSILWTIMDDFVTKVFTELYQTFSGVFQRISDSQFKDIGPKD